MNVNVVAAIDFSDVTGLVLELAGKEVRMRSGELHVVNVVPIPIAAPVGVVQPSAGITLTDALDAARNELERVVRATPALGGLKVIGHVRTGTAEREIITVANEVDADLIVVGASTKGLAARALLGSTARPLASSAPCSLLVARLSSVPEIEPRRADQDDDIHKRHHPQAHHYSEPPERLGRENESFRFGIQT